VFGYRLDTLTGVPAVPVLVVQLAASDPIGRLGEWLRVAGLDLDIRNLSDGGALPDGLSGHAGLVVLGGEMSATDDVATPTLPQVRALLRDAVSREVPTLGVCLGAQLLATANGGRVSPNPDGPEFGAQLIAKRQACADDPLFGPLPITPDVIQWHFDAIDPLPPGAVQLASAPGCDMQAFRLGRLAWGIQFHIETTPELVREWAAADADALDGYDVERLLSRSDAVHGDLVEVWQPFAAAFADVVRDPASVDPSRAVATSTAEPITDPAAIRAALAAELTASRGGAAALPMPSLRQPGHD
jgi:GMP synthase (glutamine-hydrolysing)